jgi:hypothetical protein
MTRRQPFADQDGAEACRRCGRPLTDVVSVHDRLGAKCRRRWLVEEPASPTTCLAAQQTAGEILRDHRRQRGLGQREAAALAAVNRTKLQLAEQDRQRLPLPALTRLAAVLDPDNPARLLGQLIAARTPQEEAR